MVRPLSYNHSPGFSIIGIAMDRWEFFQDSKGLWRWRCTSRDGNVVLNSAEAYPLRVQALAEALEHGFVEGASAVDSDVTREIQPGSAPADLEVLKLQYASAFSAYEGSLAALAHPSSTTGSSSLREEVAKALRALEVARKKYREALFEAAFSDASSAS